MKNTHAHRRPHLSYPAALLTGLVLSALLVGLLLGAVLLLALFNINPG